MQENVSMHIATQRFIEYNRKIFRIQKNEQKILVLNTEKCF